MLERDVLSFIKKYPDKPAPDSEFDSLALRVFRHQFKNNKNYRKFCEIDGKTIVRVKTWREIPAMPALGFKELVLTTFPVKGARRVFRTSGTSGKSSRGAHFFETLKLYDAAVPGPFRRHLLGDGKKRRFFFLTHSPLEVRDSSLSYMMGVVNRKFSRPAGLFYVKKDAVLCDKLIRDLSREKSPVMLLATAFSFKAFLDYLRAHKIKLKLPDLSRVMETGGFKGKVREVSKAELYRACSVYLGIPKKYCVSEYGMTELTSQFYRRATDGFFEGPGWMRTLVLDKATGKEVKNGTPGVLMHLDLANLGSVAAVLTEDIGRTVDKGFEVLSRAKGSELRGCSLSYEEFIRS